MVPQKESKVRNHQKFFLTLLKTSSARSSRLNMSYGTILEVLVWSLIAVIGLLEILRLLLAATFAAGWQDYKSILGQVYENMRGECWKNARQVKQDKTGSNCIKEILLSDQQIERIRARKWKEVLAWIAFHPDELHRVDRKHRTALHFACLVQAPVEVIEMMLFQAPDLAFMKNDDQELPLHWAVRLSASKEIIKWLLNVNPRSGWAAKDREGNTPLSLTWERHEQSLMNDWWTVRRNTMSLDPRWKRVMMFLKAYEICVEAPEFSQRTSSSGPNDLTSEPTEPLHLACRCPICPASLFSFLLILHRTSVRTKDVHGFLPLHYACMDYRSNRSVGALTKIELLLNEYPGAASEPEDGFGRIPLFLALRGEISWEEGVLRLIEAFPKSLQAVDPQTQLPAFAVAAMEQSNPKEVDDEPADEPRQLSLVFKLLRKDPSMTAERRQSRK